MKNLLMIRHSQTEMMAKSDMVRQLTKQGTVDAFNLGQKFHKDGISADIIVSSPAARAQKTAQLIARGIRYDENAIVTEKLLYHGHTEEIVSFIRNFGNTVESLIIVGHNPVMMQAINMLGNEKITHLIAGHAVKFQFDTDSWKDVGPETCSYLSRC
jgi:phosphohistidine phosphatase